MAWSRRADLGGEGTTRAMHRPHNSGTAGAGPAHVEDAHEHHTG